MEVSEEAQLTVLATRLCGAAPHVLILYGSHARGDASDESDYDMAAFLPDQEKTRHVIGRWDGRLIDLFVLATARLVDPGPEDMHMLAGRLLVDRQGDGADFLRGLEAVHRKGPPRCDEDEIKVRKAWAWKMLDRLGRGDVEAHYRRAWLLTSQLENHFAFQGVWYLGSKAAFQHLRTANPRLFARFEAALAPGANLEAVEALVEAVNGPRPATGV